MARTAIVVCAGGPARAALPEIPEDALVIAADGGILEAERLGLRVDLLVGDLDSAPADGRSRARRGSNDTPSTRTRPIWSSRWSAAVAAEARRIVVVGGDGGRLDHLLGNAFLLGSDRWAAVEIDAVLGDARIWVVRDERSIDGEVGELVSLYAVGGPARGVTTEGLRWALRDGELSPGSSLGLSNEFAAASRDRPCPRGRRPRDPSGASPDDPFQTSGNPARWTAEATATSSVSNSPTCSIVPRTSPLTPPSTRSAHRTCRSAATAARASAIGAAIPMQTVRDHARHDDRDHAAPLGRERRVARPEPAAGARGAHDGGGAHAAGQRVRRDQRERRRPAA